MRVNIYAEEMTDLVSIIEKETPDGKFTGVRFWLQLPVTKEHDYGTGVSVIQEKGPFIHHPGDDDSAAVTFWGKKELLVALKKAVELLEAHKEKS